ncbi:MAG: HlyD family efflux transporter periplasmic adaptor subunit [Cyanobacteria bacterium P01_F01_bin.86]
MGQLKENASGKFFRLRLRPHEEVVQPKEAKRPRLRLPLLPRWWPYGLAGLGITVLVALAFRPAPIAVDVGQVTQGPFKVTLDAEGKTRVQERYIVAAPVAGRLQRINLEAGDTVESGAIVAKIDPLPLETEVRAAQSRLQVLQAELTGVETQRPKSQELVQAEARLRSAEAEQQAAAANVDSIRAALEQASRDRDRNQTLEAQGAISRQTFEASELEETRLLQELEAAQQVLEGAIADIANARETIPLLQAEQSDPDYLIDVYQAQIVGIEAELANLADEARRTTIYAPVGGKVLRLPEASARFVPAGEPLIELGDPTQLELVIDVLSTDAVQISPGDPIIVEKWGHPTPLSATVSYIEPGAFTEVSALGVEEQRVNVIATLADPITEIPAPEATTTILGDGYRIEARIVIWANDSSLQVPISALYRCDQDWCVFVIEGNRAQPRKIDVIQQSTVAAAIVSGVQAGEQIILYPNEQIEAGRRVKLR